MPRHSFAQLREMAKTAQPKKRFTTPFEKEIACGSIYIAASPQNTMRFEQSVRLAMDLSAQAKVFYINVTRTQEDVSLYAPDYPSDNTNFEAFYLEAPDLSLRFDEVQTAATEAGAEIIVIGSFEIAAVSARHRLDLAVQCMQLAKKGVAVVVFTSEKHGSFAKSRRGPLGLLATETADIWDLSDGEPDSKERYGYMDYMEAREKELAENPPPPPEVNLISYEDFGGVPIEQVLPESDWDNPLYTNIPKMCEVIKELRERKERGLLRLDPDKNPEYMRECRADKSLINNEIEDV
jgi:hypothetical protein